VIVFTNNISKIAQLEARELHISAYNPQHREACINAFLSNVPEFFTVPEIDQYKRWLQQIEDNNGHHYYVVYINDQLVACGGFSRNENNTVSFTWGLVHRHFHKQRIGEQLLTFRLQKIKETYPDLVVVLDTTQHSYTFFERYGFVTEKYTENGYAPGMHRYDMVLKTNNFQIPF
jgi:predicted GNAT family N-acyltransferase